MLKSHPLKVNLSSSPLSFSYLSLFPLLPARMPAPIPYYGTSAFRGPDRFKNKRAPYERASLTSQIEPYLPPGIGDTERRHKGGNRPGFLSSTMRRLPGRRGWDIPPRASPGMVEQIVSKKCTSDGMPGAIFRSNLPRISVSHRPTAASHIPPYDTHYREIAHGISPLSHGSPSSGSLKAGSVSHESDASLPQKGHTARTDAKSLPSNVERVRGYAFGKSCTARLSIQKKSYTANIDYRSPKSFVEEILQR